MNAMEQKVYDYIKKHKPSSQTEIWTGLEMDAGNVSKAIKSLQLSGKVDYRPAKYEISK